MGFDLNQFCEHTKPSTVLGANELRKGSNTRPPVLKANSEATVVMEWPKHLVLFGQVLGIWLSSLSTNLKYQN
jgi:hypothetical protein